ncbi:hypothetical protein GCM10028790_25690 [Micromonospora taraxaci]
MEPTAPNQSGTEPQSTTSWIGDQFISPSWMPLSSATHGGSAGFDCEMGIGTPITVIRVA